eukprot:IDg19061t1
MFVTYRVNTADLRLEALLVRVQNFVDGLYKRVGRVSDEECDCKILKPKENQGVAGSLTRAALSCASYKYYLISLSVPKFGVFIGMRLSSRTCTMRNLDKNKIILTPGFKYFQILAEEFFQPLEKGILLLAGSPLSYGQTYLSIPIASSISEKESLIKLCAAKAVVLLSTCVEFFHTARRAQ